MARYDYRCKKCDSTTLVRIPMSEFDSTPPPECINEGHGPMKRVFNGHMAVRLSVSKGTHKDMRPDYPVGDARH